MDFEDLDREYGIRDALERNGIDPDRWSDLINMDIHGEWAIDAEDVRHMPHAAYDFEDVLNWVIDAGIEDIVEIWYDDDTGEWHYAIDVDSP